MKATVKHTTNHWELSNGNLIYLEHERGAHIDTEKESLSTWEKITFVAEKAYDSRDIGGLFFDGSVIVLLRHTVSVPVLFLIGGIMLGLWMLRIKIRMDKSK